MERISTVRALGASVSRARRGKGLTQVELSAMAGVSRQLVNRLEMGTAGGIAFEKLLAILSALDCGLLIDQDEDPCAPHEKTLTSPSRNSHALPMVELPPNYYLDTTLLSQPPKES